MDILLLGGAVSVVALVGLRRRHTNKEAVHGEPQASQQLPPRPSHEYLKSLLIPCLVGTVLLAAYYSVLKDVRIRQKETQCRSPSPEERASRWHYALDDTALRNVSDERSARKLFSQALVMRYGYSIEGAQTSFSAALEVDPACAMCHWGMAYSLAPFVNIVALPDGTRHPYYSTQMNRDARRYLKKAEEGPFRSEDHRTYVDAMWIRFPEVQYVERRHQEWREFLYGAKMMSLWNRHRTDATAASLAAEAFANYRPWDFHSTDVQPTIDDMTWSDLIAFAFPDRDVAEFEDVTGIDAKEKVLKGMAKTDDISQAQIMGSSMRPIARLAERLLLFVLKKDASHPLATHLHIHLAEATKGHEPSKALSSASNLERVGRNWKSGHLMHMASHIYFRVGAHGKSVIVNRLALEIDIETSEACVHPYIPEHNLKLLVASASMGGLAKDAETYAIRLRDLRSNIAMDKYMSSGFDYVTLLDVWGHFGRWDKILSVDPPAGKARGGSGTGGLEYATAMYHFYRALAFSHAPGNASRYPTAFEIERKRFLEAVDRVPVTAKTIPGEGIGIYASGYSYKTKMAVLYLQARNASLLGDMVGAIGYVREVVSIVEGMGYMEPPWTQQAPKQCLGYLLTRKGDYPAASSIFQEDLIENPNNPWSMIGSAHVAEAVGRNDVAETILDRFASTGSDKLECSCPMLSMERSADGN